MSPLPRSLAVVWMTLVAGPALAGQDDASDPASPESFVEFVGGDMLPGTVEAYRSGRETLEERLPPHLVVRPRAAPAAAASPATVRVPVNLVRRVVWKRGRAAAPGSIRVHDGGREIPFASMRWREEGLLVLSETGATRFAFADLAELSLEPRDPWDAYFATVATLAPGDGERLLRCTTRTGLVVTASPERWQKIAVTTTKSQPPTAPSLHVQPAWSLDPLSIPEAEIAARLEFLPQEVPLTLIAPARADRKAVFGGLWGWNVDRNVQGGMLSAGGRRAAWGFGVQASCDLVFPLPPGASAVRTAVALDGVVGVGGCAVARVLLSPPTAAPLWESPPLVGTGSPVETGNLPLPVSAAQGLQLVLSADMAHEGKPSSADPHDVRDVVDWFDPIVVLDAENLRGEITRRLPATIVPWEGWEATLPPGATLAVRTRPTPTGFIREVVPRGGPLSLRRRVDVTAETAFLVVGLVRSGDGASRCEIRIDGTTVATTDVPQQQDAAPVKPFLVSLSAFEGRAVQIEIVHAPVDDNGFVTWHVADVSGPLESKWHLLDVVEASAESDATLTLEHNGAVLAGGAMPAMDEYVIRVHTEQTGITGLRLEGLTHASLARGGPGRPGNNNFVLTAIAAEAISSADPRQTQEARFAKAVATPERPGFPAAAIIDADPRSGWCNHGQPGIAVLSFAKPVGFPGGTDIVVRLSFRYAPWPQHTLGCFRLLATTATHPSFDLPGVVLPEPAATPASANAARP